MDKRKRTFDIHLLEMYERVQRDGRFISSESLRDDAIAIFENGGVTAAASTISTSLSMLVISNAMKKKATVTVDTSMI